MAVRIDERRVIANKVLKKSMAIMSLCLLICERMFRGKPRLSAQFCNHHLRSLLREKGSKHKQYMSLLSGV